MTQLPDLNALSAYEYELPQELIATEPANPRDSAKLMCVRGSQRSHHIFRDIEFLLNPGDLIVVNDVTVQRARFFAQRKTGGRVEVLITDDAAKLTRTLKCLWKANHKIPENEELTCENDPSVHFTLKKETSSEENADALGSITFLGDEPVIEILSRIGELPLPPYIRKRRQLEGNPMYNDRDDEDYQTVYAKEGAAVAAPTAGLHFTSELLERLAAKNIRMQRLRLDVGPGTFRPIRAEHLSDHNMHTEHYYISESLKNDIEATRARGNRIVAVGTTVVRSLEDQAQRFGKIVPGEYDTNIFIKPGHQFKMIDAMVTNFHLPGSTLMVLVSAFAGYQNICDAYREAVENRYHFYSYGDAMLLFPENADE